MSLKLNIDVAGIAAQFKELALEAEQALMFGVQQLTRQVHAHILEEASNGENKLHSSLSTYKEALSQPEQIANGIWVITLDESAMWIEEGMEAQDMKPKLLKGENWKVIPFDQNKRPQDRTGKDNNIMSELKAGLRQINKERKQKGQEAISLSKIEKNADNSPRIGKLHEFNIESKRPTENAKHPALKGLTIYQSLDPKTGNVRRDVLTFRTVSKNSPENSWKHPGVEAKKFFDEAYEWAQKEWENKILPEILESLGK